VRGFRYLKDVVTLELDQPACIGCGMCTEVCTHQVFVMNGKKALLQDRDACMECGACALNCPVKAIVVDAGVGCASGMINEWLQEHKLGTLNGGGCS
jgi:NAD-dependent dihydropyrimidine dehydrogenase PreA subunit